MNETSRFSIYYKQGNYNNKDEETFILSFSRMSISNDMYKQKIVFEQNGQKFKSKELHTNIFPITSKIEQIDFNKEYPVAVPGEDYYLIEYDEKRIETSSKESVQNVLDLFEFDNLLAIPKYHYQYIKDIYEYVHLNKLLEEKVFALDRQGMVAISKFLKDNNPYIVFQSMMWLEAFIEEIVKGNGK